MSHVVIATLDFKNEAGKKKFLDILASPDGLVKTRSWQGCRLIECCIPNEGNNAVVLYERWDKEADHASYMKMRKETGLFDVLADLLKGGMEGLKKETFTLHSV